MPITHKDLLKIMQKLGYQINQGGMCYGFSCMAISAILSGDIATYNRRLRLLELPGFHGKKETFILQKINSVRKKSAKKESLTNEEKYWLSVPAFFDGVALYYAPYLYPYLYPEDNLYVMSSISENDQKKLRNVFILVADPLQLLEVDKAGNYKKILDGDEVKTVIEENELKKILTMSASTPINTSLSHEALDRINDILIIRANASINSIPKSQDAEKSFLQMLSLPQKLRISKKIKDLSGKEYTIEKPNIERIGVFSGIYNKKGLEKCFAELRKIAQNHSEPMGFQLGNGNHALTVGYDPARQCWQWINASEALEIKENTEIAKKAIKTFSKNNVTSISASIFVRKISSKQAKENFDRCKQERPWKDLHRITTKKIEAKDSHGTSWLYIASRIGDTESVKLLLENKADPNQARSSDGATPLFIAAQNGHSEIVKLLLENKAEPDQTRSDGATPLFFIAAHKGDYRIIELLLKHGANPNQARSSDGATPLFAAAYQGHLDTVKCLFNSGKIKFDVSITARVTMLLGYARKNQREDQVTKMLSKDKNNPHTLPEILPYFTPFHAAVYLGHIEIVKFFLEPKNSSITNINEDLLNELINWSSAINHTAITTLLTERLKEMNIASNSKKSVATTDINISRSSSTSSSQNNSSSSFFTGTRIQEDIQKEKQIPIVDDSPRSKKSS